MTALILYCAFAYGYGLSVILDIIVDKAIEKIYSNRKLGYIILFISWILFPFIWPISGIYIIICKILKGK